VIRALVVEPEAWTRAAVAAALRRAGFATHEAADVAGAERAAAGFRPELVVLDPSVANGAGLELARALRAERGTPLLIVTRAETVEERVAGLEVADDYVLKPVDPAEVVARARALVRRARRSFGPLVLADLTLDEATREVVRAGRLVELTPTEFDLLRFFLLNPRRVLSKPEIYEAVWGEPSDGDVSSVETYVGYLRKKLDALGPPLIRTVRLVGYVLRES
jgi:two-component system OmpR family response regulator